MKDDWNKLLQFGWGMNKRDAKNQRVAQFKLANYNFTGGIYNNIVRGNDFKHAENFTEMMTWLVLCAKFTEKAIIANIVIDIVCVLMLWMFVCMSILSLCVCV